MVENLNPLYKALNEAIQKQNDDQVLKLSDQILQSTPKDLDILICKAVSLIKIGRNSEALNLINPKEIKSDPNLAYSYAYNLYKMNKFNECLNVIKEFQNDPSINHPGFFLLEAQILFKQGSFDDGAKLYLELLKKFHSSEEYGDIIVNALGAGGSASESFQRRAAELGEEHMKRGDSMKEALFNLSLILTKIGKLREAKNVLKKCISMIFEENGPDPESLDSQSFTDFVSANAQLDTIDFQLYDFSAEDYDLKIKQYQDYLGKELTEKNLKVVLNNNIVALRSQTKNESYADSMKKLDEALQKEQKQIKSQIFSIKLNRVFLNLMKNKLNDATKYLNDLENSADKRELASNQNFILAKAFLLFKSRKTNELDAFLNSLEEKQSEQQFKGFLHLLRAELERLQHDYKKVLERLEALAKQQPSLFENEVFCGFIFSLASSHPDLHAQSHELLRKIVANTYSPQILFPAAETSIKQRDYANAAEILNRVLKKHPDNLKAKYKLLYCLSYCDPSQISSLITSLPKEKLITDIKRSKKLESDLSLAKDNKGGAKGDQSPGLLSDKSKKIKKKKRKIKYPKKFDPANPGPKADPERWLPKYKRSKFKNQSKKKGLLRGPQGETGGKDIITTTKNTSNIEVSKEKTKNKKKR